MRTLVLGLLAAVAVAAPEDIAKDVRLGAGSRTLDRPLRVVADGVTLDLGEAVLQGPAAAGDPDGFTGIGLLIEGRRDVTVRGGRLRGFKCAILVRDCENIVLEDLDVSGNFRQRLRSTPEREDASDWLWPHKNDEQEWRRNYGAGICIENSRGCVVRRCTGRRQQNGIILDRCTATQVYDNDMSFNSGWGLAMWRSSHNTVSKNSFDWCVRGYSHGVYDRGQDSAGILVFEQCNRNRFDLNSATHGGDGFFLYAGHETTKKTGQGGCNDNVIYKNDFSHAVANAIEATFSSNYILENRCDDSNYGIWAGYSYDTVIAKNTMRDNSIAGIAIEHGTGNRLLRNRFERNPRGIWLWWDNDKELLAGAFGRARDCRSHDCLIRGNRFFRDKTAVYLRDTTQYWVEKSDCRFVGTEVNTNEKCRPAIAAAPDEPPAPPMAEPPGKRQTMLPEGHPRGRKYIMIDEWGPVHPTEHSVFPANVVGWGGCAFHVLGAGDYEVTDLTDGLGVERDGRTFRVVGGDGVTPFAAVVMIAEKRFPISGLLLNARWRIRHWTWTKDPREHAWDEITKAEPVADRTGDRLDFHWQNKAPAEGVPADRFATRASTTMKLPAGKYEIRTVSDDGIRVRIDGKVVQEDWTWHGPTEHKTVVELAAGKHDIEIDHFEIDGYAVLTFDLRPVK